MAADQPVCRLFEGNQQYEKLGNRLFPLVYKEVPHIELAGKVTGMLLELDTNSIYSTPASAHTTSCQVERSEGGLGA